MVENFNTPILFLIFNRPDTTQRVFDEIKRIKPPFLYVAADGHRKNVSGEKEDCLETRAIINQIDWDCKLHTLYREENLGCRVAVSSAIDWFFSNVEEGIILEDDCLPSQSYFWFCQELLKTYRFDTRIMHISGGNFQFGRKRGEATYYFSRIAHVWGWASWRRAWQLYDVEMKLFPKFKKEKKIQLIFDNANVQNDWIKNLSNIYNGANTWDYQWSFANFINQGLCIIPNINLISNIGFGDKSTHTINKNDVLANMPIGSIDKIVHPVFFLVDKQADHFTNIKVFNPPSLIKRIKNKIYRMRGST